MVTPIFDLRPGRVRSARASGAESECLRYRLDVVGGSAVDVVQSTGGWLYDRVMAGWEVTVLLPHGGDPRSLRILGVGVSDLRSLDGTDAASHGLAVSAEAFTADARVRDRVRKSLDSRLTEVALWGRPLHGWPLGPGRALTRAQHILSAAARTFKGHALGADGIDCDSVDPTETLWCDPRSPVDSQLVRLD